MTEFIALIFSIIFIISIASSGVLARLYRPQITKNLEKHLYAFASVLIIYTLLFNIIPIILEFKTISVLFFIILLTGITTFFEIITFIWRKLFSPYILKFFKANFATEIYGSAIVFAIFGAIIGVAFATNISTGLLVSTFIALISFLKFTNTAKKLTSIKVSYLNIIKSSILSSTTILPFAVLFYVLGNIKFINYFLLILTTSFLISLTLYIIRRFFSFYDLKINIDINIGKESNEKH